MSHGLLVSALLNYTGAVGGSVGATAAFPNNALIKSKPHRDTKEFNSTAAIVEVSAPHQSNSQSMPQPDPIAQFPTQASPKP